jgi:hypothetical protein
MHEAPAFYGVFHPIMPLKMPRMQRAVFGRTGPASSDFASANIAKIQYQRKSPHSSRKLRYSDALQSSSPIVTADPFGSGRVGIDGGC